MRETSSSYIMHVLVVVVIVVILASAYILYAGPIYTPPSIQHRMKDSEQLASVVLAPRLTTADVVALRQGQAKITEMLRVFDQICLDHSIDYFAIGGTLLGAVAYQNWVPWDGDADVEILYSHWPKLRKALKNLPDSMWLQTEDTDKHFRSWLPRYVVGKIRDLDSCYLNCQDGVRYHNGFMIDLNLYYIDPQDKVVIPDNTRVDYMTRKDLYPLQRVKFDGITINAPNNPEKYLTRNYGKEFRDFLPVQKRYPHEGTLDPHRPCKHHAIRYPHMYDSKGMRRT